MADTQIPPGWKKDGNNGYYSSTSQPVSGKPWIQTSVNPSTGDRIIYSITPQISTGLVNQVTGQSFDIGGARKEIMSIDSNGKVTKLKHYEDTGVAVYGTDGLSKLKNSSKDAAVSLMSQSSLTSNAAKESKEFKSALENTKSNEESDSGQAEGVTPESFNQDSLNKQITDRKGGVRQDYGNMKYPRDAKFMSEQDCIKFTMFRYQPKKVAITSGLGAFSGSNKGKPMGTVLLPIQPSINDSNLVSWGENPMNALDAAAAAAAMAGIMQGPEGVGKRVEDIAKGIRENKSDAVAALAAGFASQAAGGNQGFLTRSTGGILNNNLELLFQGPSLRTFSFTFSMSARYEAESEEIRKIIRFFKQGMSVKRSEGDLFLKSPNIFDIQYYHKNKEHRYINKIKTCALQTCVVNYTPAGNYATYNDGAMTQYDMTLTFGEIEPLFDDDYGQSDDGLIGY